MFETNPLHWLDKAPFWALAYGIRWMLGWSILGLRLGQQDSVESE